MTAAAARPDRVALGVATMVATALAMSFGDAVVKLVSADFTVWQIYVARSALAIPMIVALLAARRPRAVLPRALLPRALGWAVVRSLLLMAMWIAFYMALPLLSLSVVAAAYYTGPLFITLFGALLIGEPVGARRWCAIAIGFIGVLVILKPGGEAFDPLALLPVVAAVFYAGAAIVTRAKLAEENPFALSLILNLAFLAVGVLATAGLALWQPDVADGAAYRFMLGTWSVMGVREWAVMALLAGLIVVISSGVAKAYQCAPPAVIAAFDYSYLVFAALWSLAIFAEAPSMTTLSGMALIAGAGLLAIAPATVWRRLGLGLRS
jgi:drug/metabolite transporter (DMT)-like permease